MVCCQRLKQQGEELDDDMEDEFYLKRLDCGLFTLQLIDYIMLEVCASGATSVSGCEHCGGCACRYILWKRYIQRGGVAQLGECRIRDPKIGGSNPACVRSTRKKFVSQKCCADSLPMCPTPVCTRTHKNNHVGLRTLKIL